jgi:hypothetical protein
MYTYTGDTTGATIGAGTTYPSATPTFNLCFCTHDGPLRENYEKKIKDGVKSVQFIKLQ